MHVTRPKQVSVDDNLKNHSTNTYINAYSIVIKTIIKQNAYAHSVHVYIFSQCNKNVNKIDYY